MDQQDQIIAEEVMSLETKALVKICLKIMIIMTIKMITLHTILLLTKETYQHLLSLIPPQRLCNSKTIQTKLTVSKIPSVMQKRNVHSISSPLPLLACKKTKKLSSLSYDGDEFFFNNFKSITMMQNQADKES